MLNPKLMKQMQQRIGKMQQEMTNLRVEATAGGGAVKVVATGDQKIVSVEIDPAACDPGDVEMLQDLVVVAVNDALDQARDRVAKELSSLTGNARIPGLF